MSCSSVDASSRRPSPAIATAAWHALLWLVVGNAIGVMIALLLLVPALNQWLDEWTYGRWIAVHMNIMLYGWSSLPMAGFLFKAYGADRGLTARWCRPVLWAWSWALAVGAFTWLFGHSSGKLFLDWSGYSRILFPLAMLSLWLLLAISFAIAWSKSANQRLSVTIGKLLGLVILLAAPLALYAASGPGFYPAVNPDSGGPTGTSQLESSLAVVLIILVLPFGLARRKPARRWPVILSWCAFVAELLLCAALTRGDITHRNPFQIGSLASILFWLLLVPAYYAAFEWHPETRRWRFAFLAWWSGLVFTGWVLFLPGVLDRLKFTDGLVAHSFVAMAGFVSALLIFVMVQLLGEGGWILTRSWSFHLWNWSVLAYAVVATIAGWFEGADPAFTIIPGPARNTLYLLRLATGVLMFVASLEWFVNASLLLRELEAVPVPLARKKVA